MPHRRVQERRPPRSAVGAIPLRASFIQDEVTLDRIIEDLDAVRIEGVGPGHRYGTRVGRELNSHDGVMSLAEVPARWLGPGVVDVPVVRGLDPTTDEPLDFGLEPRTRIGLGRGHGLTLHDQRDLRSRLLREFLPRICHVRGTNRLLTCVNASDQ